MKKTITALLVASTLAAAGAAIAQDNATPANPPAAAPDNAPAGREGKARTIDQERFSRLDALKQADKDGDGTLSRDEMEAMALDRIVKRMANRMERRLDVDGDGTVTLAEIENQRGKEFAALDRNEDGVLDRGEMRAGKHHGRDGGHHGKRGGQGQRFHR